MRDSSTDDRKVSHDYCLWSITGPRHVGWQYINANLQNLSMLKRTICA